MLLMVNHRRASRRLETCGRQGGFAFPLCPSPGHRIFSLFTRGSVPHTCLFGGRKRTICASVKCRGRRFKCLVGTVTRTLG